MQRAKGITRIEMVPDLGETPARVNRFTGVMEFSQRYANRLKQYPEAKEMILFIMLHEMAHVAIQTTVEVEADAWAFKKYADMGYSLKAVVKSLTRVLNDHNPEHNFRMRAMLERAKDYDRRVYGNTKI